MRLPKAIGRIAAALAYSAGIGALALVATALILAMIPLAVLLVAIPILAILLILGTVILCSPVVLLVVFLRSRIRPATEAATSTPRDADSGSATPGPTCP